MCPQVLMPQQFDSSIAGHYCRNSKWDGTSTLIEQPNKYHKLLGSNNLRKIYSLRIIWCMSRGLVSDPHLGLDPKGPSKSRRTPLRGWQEGGGDGSIERPLWHRAT